MLSAADGVFAPDRSFLPLLFIDGKAIEKLFQDLLLRRLHQAERLSEEFIGRIETWIHSGFSVYGEQVVMPDEHDRIERLARYLTRPPLPVASVSEDAHGRVRVATREKLVIAAVFGARSGRESDEAVGDVRRRINEGHPPALVESDEFKGYDLAVTKHCQVVLPEEQEPPQ